MKAPGFHFQSNVQQYSAPSLSVVRDYLLYKYSVKTDSLYQVYLLSSLQQQEKFLQDHKDQRAHF